MKSKKLTDLLPETSFVPFQAWRAKSPVICWENGRIPHERPLIDSAFFIPLPADAGKGVLSEEKPFFAERYGGMGLGKNGGGVRCGYDGVVQVKGIGQNPLVGSHDNYFHSYGGAAISEAVLEALWGEICQMALPFGAARAYGILKTGTSVPVKFPKSGKSRFTERALIIREAVLRPAHFMRAVFFSSSDFPSSSDAARVCKAIQKLDFALSSLYEHSYPVDPAPTPFARFEFIRSSLVEFFRRAAFQIAAARARRIMHGSLTGSNFAFSGQWLDFGSISAVSDYGRIIIPRGAPDFMHEEELLLPVLQDLVFYLNKYSGLSQYGLLFEVQPFWDWFHLILKERLRLEFLLLTGVPEAALQQVEEAVKDELYSCMSDVMCAGNRAPFTILVDDNDYVPVMPSVMGKYHLPSILTEAAVSKSAVDLETALEGALGDQSLRQRFVKAYFTLRSTIAHKVEDLSPNFICLNAIRRNLLADELYRTVLYPKIDELVEMQRDISAFIEERIKLAELLMAPERNGRFIADLWFGTDAVVDSKSGVRISNAWMDYRGAIANLDPMVTGEELKTRIIAYAT